MNSEKIFVLAIVIGVVLSVFGLFLPWGKQESIPVMEQGRLFLGVELILGQFALLGCVITAAALLFFGAGKKKYSRCFMLLGGLITLAGSLTWIVNLGALALSGWFLYKIVFGVYVSFAGSLLTSAGAIFTFLHH